MYNTYHFIKYLKITHKQSRFIIIKQSITTKKLLKIRVDAGCLGNLFFMEL